MRDHRSSKRTSSRISLPPIATLQRSNPVQLSRALKAKTKDVTSFNEEAVYSKILLLGLHHGTMRYCNVHYGLAHLTFPYAVYNTVQCCKWIIILLDSLYRYILDILFQFTCHISLKPVLPRGLF